MKKTFLSVVFIVVFILSVSAFAQSIEIISVYPKAQFSAENLSTSNFTLTFNISNDNYLQLFLTNVSTAGNIKVDWQNVSLLLSGQTIEPNFKVTPPSVIQPGLYAEAEIKLSNDIFPKSSVITVLLPISVHNSLITYKIRLKVELSALTSFKKHLWAFPLQWGTVNFNKKGQAISTTDGLFGLPFLVREQKNFFSPLHTGVNTYWEYTTLFVIIPVEFGAGADYITSGGFYIGLGAYWSPIVMLAVSNSNSGYYGYQQSNPFSNLGLGIGIDFGFYY